MSKCVLWQGPVLMTVRQQGVVPPQEHGGVMTRWRAVVEGRVYSSIFELLRQLNSIIICRWITRDDSHWSNVLGQELSSLSLRQGKIFGR